MGNSPSAAVLERSRIAAPPRWARRVEAIRVAWQVCGLIILAGCVGTRDPCRAPSSEVERRISAKLVRLNALLSAHDLALIREFIAAPDVLLLGSEANELAIGPQQVALFFQRILGEPETASWEWNQTRISAHGRLPGSSRRETSSSVPPRAHTGFPIG